MMDFINLMIRRLHGNDSDKSQNMEIDNYPNTITVIKTVNRGTFIMTNVSFVMKCKLG